jgi:hypothetical protein
MGGSCHRYKSPRPSNKNAAGTVANHPRHDHAYYLGAEADSAGAAGVIRGSPCHYQTPAQLKKNLGLFVVGLP